MSCRIVVLKVLERGLAGNFGVGLYGVELLHGMMSFYEMVLLYGMVLNAIVLYGIGVPLGEWIARPPQGPGGLTAADGLFVFVS